MYSQGNAYREEHRYPQQYDHVPPVEAPLGWLLDSKQSGSLAHMPLPVTLPLYDST